MRISDWSSDVCSSDLVHRFLLQPDGGEEFQRSVTQQVDRADFRPKRLGDDLHDAVELGLRRGARGHDIMQTRQYFAGGGGGCLLHEHELADYRPSVKRLCTAAQRRGRFGEQLDRKSVVEGKRWSGLVDLGGRRSIKK